jgi:hypothetical protein
MKMWLMKTKKATVGNNNFNIIRSFNRYRSSFFTHKEVSAVAVKSKKRSCFG